MNLESLLDQLNNEPTQVEFNQVMDIIQSLYNYTPTQFTNGLNQDTVTNEAGSNEGSCKLFAFAQDQSLTEEQTLACFGHYYREDVLNNPDGSDHANIRNFIKYGWQGIRFDNFPLTKK
jgi:hypothetical protein